MPTETPRKQQPVKGTLLALRHDSPRTKKGAGSSIFVFQYNPDKLIRTFGFLNQDSSPTADSEAPNTPGSPIELIYLKLELDVADQADGKSEASTSAEVGLHPSLATLELMMQPEVGEKGEYSAPVLLFSWGAKRTIPVALVSMKISEETFDITLNPTRATVDICLRTLQPSELKKNSAAQAAYQKRQVLRSTLASLYKQPTE